MDELQDGHSTAEDSYLAARFSSSSKIKHTAHSPGTDADGTIADLMRQLRFRRCWRVRSVAAALRLIAVIEKTTVIQRILRCAGDRYRPVRSLRFGAGAALPQASRNLPTPSCVRTKSFAADEAEA
jgi:hypothetical protein